MGGPKYNWNNTTPAAPGGYANVKWQSDGGSPIENITAYVPAAASATGLIKDTFTPDGFTQTFMLSETPTGAVELVWNGLIQAIPDDYSVSGTTITTVFTAGVNDHLSAYYGSISSGGGGGLPSTDQYILGAADPTNLPNSVGWPGAYYGPDIVPSSPTSYDDEFNGSTLNSAWTWLQQGAATATIASSCIALLGDSSAAYLRGVYKAVPGTTPWEFAAGFQLDGGFGNYILAGLMLYESSTGKQMWWGPTFDTGFTPVLGWGTTGASVNNYAYTGPLSSVTNSKVYCKVRNDGTNLIFSYSVTGVSYYAAYTVPLTTHFTTAPNNIGLGIAAYGANAVLVSDWFRRTG